jgi:hypothetical protein
VLIIDQAEDIKDGARPPFARAPYGQITNGVGGG